MDSNTDFSKEKSYAKRKNQNFVTGFSSSGEFSSIVVEVLKKNTTNIAEEKIQPWRRPTGGRPIGVVGRTFFAKQKMAVCRHGWLGFFQQT